MLNQSPSQNDDHKSLEEIFIELERSVKVLNEFTIQDFFDLLGTSGHLLFCLLFVIPFLQPIPLPGLSTPFGLTIFFVALFYCLGKKPWLPKAIKERKVGKEALQKIISAARKVLEKLHKFFKPRQVFWINLYPKLFRQWLPGILIAINGLKLSLPLPIPFSNSTPAISTFVLTLALMQEDDYALILGYITFIFSTLYFIFILFILPYYGIQFFQK